MKDATLVEHDYLFGGLRTVNMQLVCFAIGPPQDHDLRPMVVRFGGDEIVALRVVGLPLFQFDWEQLKPSSSVTGANYVLRYWQCAREIAAWFVAPNTTLNDVWTARMLH